MPGSSSQAKRAIHERVIKPLHDVRPLVRARFTERPVIRPARRHGIRAVAGLVRMSRSAAGGTDALSGLYPLDWASFSVLVQGRIRRRYHRCRRLSRAGLGFVTRQLAITGKRAHVVDDECRASQTPEALLALAR